MRVVFMGTPDFAVPCLQNIIDSGYNVVGVVTQPDRPKGRKQILTKSPVKVLAEKLNLEVFQPEKIKDSEAIEHILSWNPDIIITAAYGQIIPEKLLEAPKHKGINVHASILPKYRGAAPIHKAIIDGEKETGITIMYMVKELDAGDIITQEKIAIEYNDTTGILHDKLSKVGSELLISTLKLIEDSTIQPTAQNSELATFAPTLKRNDELIDWNMSNENIYDLVRGLNPWPISFTYVNGEVFKIWWAEPINCDKKYTPGTVVRIDKECLYIACSVGALSLIEVQPAGKRKMNINSYLQGSKLKVGDIIGEKNG